MRKGPPSVITEAPVSLMPCLKYLPGTTTTGDVTNNTSDKLLDAITKKRPPHRAWRPFPGVEPR